jgi:hypothetical protein
MSPAAHALLELAEAECLLVEDDAAGRVEELAELQDRRDQLLAQLPAQLDADDRVAIQRALELQSTSTMRLQSARDAVLVEIRRAGHGRRAAQGYSPAGVSQAGTLNLRG